MLATAIGSLHGELVALKLQNVRPGPLASIERSAFCNGSISRGAHSPAEYVDDRPVGPTAVRRIGKAEGSGVADAAYSAKVISPSPIGRAFLRHRELTRTVDANRGHSKTVPIQPRGCRSPRSSHARSVGTLFGELVRGCGFYSPHERSHVDGLGYPSVGASCGVVGDLV